jgi:CubicO group peptidase (beta-lactamase class C family)
VKEAFLREPRSESENRSGATMARLIAAAVLAALLQCVTWAGGQPAIAASDAARITAFLQGFIDRGEIPGAVALVTGRDGVAFHAAFGRQDVGRNVPMAKDTIFRIASMTKPITSIAVMMLVEEGKLKLDDDASRWVPAMKGRRVFTKVDTTTGAYETRRSNTPITIRQLLTHTSGVGYAWSDPGLALATEREMPKHEDELPLANEPGERWTYGASTRVLGDIVEKISGQRIDAFLQSRVFAPLGMTDTFFEVPREKYSRVVTAHQKTDETFTEAPNPATMPVSLRADGGLLSTAEDYSRFIQMLMNDGALNGRRLLSEATVREIGRNHTGSMQVRLQPSAIPGRSKPFPLGAGFDTWGLGFQRTARPSAPNLRSEGSLWWSGLFNTQFWIDPQRQIGAVLLMQYLPFYDEAAIAALQGFERLVNEGAR